MERNLGHGARPVGPRGARGALLLTRGALLLTRGALLLTLGGCYEVDTTPSRLAPYFGEWSGQGVTLSVSRERIVYRGGGSLLSLGYVQASFRGLAGNDIVYGTRGGSRLRVDVPPHRVGNVWKMTVRGAEVQRR